MKQRKWIAAAGIVAIVLAYMNVVSPKRRAAAEDAPQGMRLKRAEMIERTRNIASQIWPNMQNFQINPEYTQVKLGVASPYSSSEPLIAAWIVGCDDVHGSALGTVTWNAETGDMLSIVAGSASTINSVGGYPRMKPDEIRKVVQHWMRVLAQPRQSAPWREVSQKSAQNVVTSEWIASDRAAQLHMNPNSGELVTFRIAARPKQLGVKITRLD